MKNRIDTILYILGLILVGILLFGIVNAYAGGVTDDNNGNKGYLFISTGENHGANSVGHWTDITTIPELKGDRGARGLQGIQGIAGIDGLNGIDGINGQDGYTPIKDVDYFDGLNGLDGKDVDPITVTNLQNTDTLLDTKINTNVVAIDNLSSVNKKQNKQLQDHENRINDLDSRVNKLEKTQYVLETSFRILDTKRISLRPFFRQNFTRNKVDVVGLKIDIKLGQSYEEKLIGKINNRLDLLEKIIGNAPVIEKVIDNKGNIKSISIVGNGLSMKGEF